MQSYNYQKVNQLTIGTLLNGLEGADEIRSIEFIEGE